MLTPLASLKHPFMTLSPAEQLRQAAQALSAERVTLRELAAAHGASAQGTLLVLLAVPCMLPIPGTGSVLGLGMLALALAMWRGHGTLHLPARVAAFEMSNAAAQRVLALLVRMYTLAGRWARTRLAGLAHDRQHWWMAPKVALMAAIIVLPLPLGNVLPAIALVLLGLGLAFRDGVAVLLSTAMAALSLIYVAALAFGAVHWGGAWLQQGLGG